MKYQKILATLIAVLLFNLVTAQNTTFSKIISTPMDESIKDVVEDSIGNFYFVGFNTIPGNFKIKTNGFVLKTDNRGSVIDSITHTSPNESIDYYYIFNDEQNNFDITGYSSYDFNWPHLKSSFIFRKITTNLQLVKSNNILLPPEYGMQNVNTRRGFNNDFLFVGLVWYASDFSFNPLYLRANSDFDSLLFCVNLDVGVPGDDIKQLEQNKYWYGSASGTILALDTLFEPTGEISKLPHDLSAGYSIQWDSDSSFYGAGGIWHMGPDDVCFIKQFHPFDSSNNLYNSYIKVDTNIYIAGYRGLSFNNKDSIFIGGTINFDFPFMEFPSWFFILQTDSLLNIRWERFYGGDAYYIMTKIKATKDGGCIAIGDRYDYLNTDDEERDIYILKLNSEGLLTSSPGKPKIQMHEALVFPNPGTEFLRVRIAAQYPQSTFELFDMTGNLVLKENIEGKWKQISTSFLPQGTYVYKIHNQQGLFENGKWVKQ